MPVLYFVVVGFASGVDLAGMVQPDHVLGVVAPVFVAGAGLRHHEGLKPFLAQFGQHRGGGNIGVTLGTALMRGIDEDGRGHTVNLVIGQRGIAAQYRGTGSETGCKHGLSPDEKGLLFKPHTGFLDSEPSLSVVWCGWHEEPGCPCCNVQPSFLGSSPATVRSPRTWAVKEKSVRVVRARRRSRGHDLTRLDGTRTRATVASKVMESGKTAGHGNGRSDVQTARKRSAQVRS